MSERKVEAVVSNTPVAQSDLLALTKSELKARLAVILDRGLVNDRLSVDLPSDVYGEWVPNDKVEIYRYEALGFEVDRKYARARALHNSGTEGDSIVGDVVFMTCPMAIKEVIEEIKRENYDKVNAPKKSKEETDFEAQARDRTSVTPPVVRSSTASVNEVEIKNAILQNT